MNTERTQAELGSKVLLDDMNILLGVLTDAPELNPSNYDHDDVCRLNTAMLEAWSICKGVVDRLSSRTTRLWGASQESEHHEQT
jgi:hypothetical protein